MRGGVLGALAVAVPGGLAMAAAGAFGMVYARAACGVPHLDAPGFRGRLASGALLVFGFNALSDPRIIRSLVAIANNEWPKNLPIDGVDRDGDGTPDGVIGDEGARVGPSVGPMQVYRGTAVELGLWVPPEGATDEQVRAAYRENARHPARVIRWGCAVFREKLRLAKGDFSLAVRRYNGSGPRAEAYRDRALAFAAKAWGPGSVA